MNDETMIPPAWDYNPSAWQQRIPLLIESLIGFCIAMYLASYQLHFIHHVWDPFFGEGTNRVLTSTLSQKFPIPDALLGACGYLLDMIFCAMGKAHRWKTNPWMVAVFGFAIGPLGLTSVLLVIAQPVLVGSWCTLCLCSATISITMISPATDELLAALQYLQRVKQKKLSVWKAFWGDKEIIHQVL